MLMHAMFSLFANPVSVLAAIPMVAFIPAVGVLMVATAFADRVPN